MRVCKSIGLLKFLILLSVALIRHLSKSVRCLLARFCPKFSSLQVRVTSGQEREREKERVAFTNHFRSSIRYYNASRYTLDDISDGRDGETVSSNDVAAAAA